MQNSAQDLTRQIHAHFSANQMEKVLTFLHEDVVVKAHAFGITLNGKEGFMGFMQSFKQAFPDVSITHQNMVAEGNKIAVEFTAEGTHTGPFNTPAGAIPPSGRKINLTVCEVLEWENGKLKSLANYQDAATLLRQIGAM